MSTAAAGTAAATETVKPRVINPWIVALAVIIPTFMEVLDTTIANVALRYIAGGLSAPSSDSEWVITSYLAANAIILPMSGWLSVRLGRRRYFLISIAVFTLASVLCGMATSLEMLIGARVLQGLAGGGLQPSSQGVLLDAFPPEKQGSAMTLFGIAALLAPVVGPTLGGYITDNYGWRWIFFINIPTGLLALWLSSMVVHDPDYLKDQQSAMRKKGAPFDTIGLCLLSLTMICWEIVLSKGQEWDWLGDPFYRVHTLLVMFAARSRHACLARTAHPESAYQFSNAGRPELSLVVHHYFLRVWRALRKHHHAAGLAAIAFWLRCHDFRNGALARGPLCRDDAVGGRSFAVARCRCALFHGRGTGHDGPWKLLDVPVDARDQPVAGGLAARRRHRGAVHDLRATERRRVSLHSKGTARRRGRVARVCCATKAAASARRSQKPFTSGATNSTVCDLANISIR